eukprot:2722124-Ditylum_brightwellii.AAC.1
MDATKSSPYNTDLSKAAIHVKSFIYGWDSSTKKKADNINNSPVHVHKTSKDKKSKSRGDVSIRGLWTNQTDSIINIQVTDSDANSYCNQTIKNHLKTQEMEKKKTYFHHYQEQRKNFTPFV